jgi:hypothetical protein
MSERYNWTESDDKYEIWANGAASNFNLILGLSIDEDLAGEVVLKLLDKLVCLAVVTADQVGLAINPLIHLEKLAEVRLKRLDPEDEKKASKYFYKGWVADHHLGGMLKGSAKRRKEGPDKADWREEIAQDIEAALDSQDKEDA